MLSSEADAMVANVDKRYPVDGRKTKLDLDCKHRESFDSALLKDRTVASAPSAVVPGHPARRLAAHAPGPGGSLRAPRDFFAPRGDVARRVRAMLCAALVILWGAPAHAQVQNAYDSANCEAAFLGLCPQAETTTTTQSLSSPAPLPLVGASAWEAGVVLAGLVSIALTGRRRKRPQDTDDAR